MIEKIDFSQSEQYTLSIRLSTDGFSFSIYNPLNGSDFFFHPYPVNTQRSMAANAKAFLAETEELKRPFKQVNILIILNAIPYYLSNFTKMNRWSHSSIRISRK